VSAEPGAGHFARVNRVHYLEMTANEFDDLDGASTINSRLEVRVTFRGAEHDTDNAGNLKACHNNCSYLAKFVKDVFWRRFL
jgi:hypothetical protein